MHRFYADPSRSDDGLFILDREDSFHAFRVLRLRPEDKAEVFFGGKRYLSVIDSCLDDYISLRPLNLLPSTEPHLSITLFQGLPKGEKMDLVIQKAVELGVTRIVPVSFSRSVVRLNEKDSVKKTERWSRIAREAGKQAGRCRITEILPLSSVTSLPSLFSSCECIAIPWEECTAGGPVSFFQRHPTLNSLGIVIGPEGGITRAEMDIMQRIGCEAITLGKRILRTETAGLAAISVFFGLYGEME